jgi:hypothetical protein
MRILFDHGTPSGIADALSAHEVTEARERDWDTISNGELLKAAEAAGFDLLLTTDKGIRYQQNLKGRRIALVVLKLEVADLPALRGSHRFGCERSSTWQLCRSRYTVPIAIVSNLIPLDT